MFPIYKITSNLNTEANDFFVCESTQIAYANRLKLRMRIDSNCVCESTLMSAIRIVGETTSVYTNRPRSCRRNDLDVCESTCMRIDLYANRPVCETTDIPLTHFFFPFFGPLPVLSDTATLTSLSSTPLQYETNP